MQNVESPYRIARQRRCDAGEKRQFTFPADAVSSQASVLDLAATLEPVGVGAYLGRAPSHLQPRHLAAAGSIAGVEGEHVVAINWLLGVVPYATRLSRGVTLDEVSAAVAPFNGWGDDEQGGPHLSPAEAYGWARLESEGIRGQGLNLASLFVERGGHRPAPVSRADGLRRGQAVAAAGTPVQIWQTRHRPCSRTPFEERASHRRGPEKGRRGDDRGGPFSPRTYSRTKT